MADRFPPPLVPPTALDATLQARGYAVLDAAGVRALAGVDAAALAALEPSWDDLPPDEYLKDGGRYRRRRHGSFVVEGGRLHPVPHRRHWQPVDYNALHGGMDRWFAPLAPATVAAPGFAALVLGIAAACQRQRPQAARWYVEAHQFRIDTSDGLGRPTPEGAHRDGVDYVAVLLVARQRIKGGETRVFEADGPQGQRFTLAEPWSLLLLDDARVIHESTPIQPLDPAGGHRDTLVLTFREHGFLGDPPGVPAPA
jgi:hypothetical protein